jgi:hypothetical protein
LLNLLLAWGGGHRDALLLQNMRHGEQNPALQRFDRDVHRLPDSTLFPHNNSLAQRRFSKGTNDQVGLIRTKATT